MKICVLANALAIHTQRWTKAFAEKGHEVHLLSIRQFHVAGVKTHTVHIGPVNTKSIIWTFLSYCYLLLSARYHLRKLKPDIVNAHYVVTHGVMAAFANYHPLVVSVWGSDVIWHRGKGEMPWFLEMIIQYVLRRADLVCATSNFLLSNVRKYAPVDAVVKHVPFGVDCELFSPAGHKESEKSAGGLRIGFVKTHVWHYGPQVLIKALPQIIEEVPEAQLIMIGRNKMGGKLKRLAKALGVLERIQFVGYVENKEIPGWLRSFDVLVNPSVCRESFGVSVLEASACGLPVIVSNAGGLTEVCVDGKTGILVEMGNVKDLAEAVVRLAKNPKLCQNMGQAGRKLVIEKYNWQNNVEEKLKLFEQQISAG